MGLLQFRDKMVRSSVTSIHVVWGYSVIDMISLTQIRHPTVAPRLIQELLDNIRRQRDGERIDRQLMRNALVREIASNAAILSSLLLCAILKINAVPFCIPVSGHASGSQRVRSSSVRG